MTYKPENLLTIIIPTTGAPEFDKAVKSAMKQTVPVDVFVVFDGELPKRKMSYVDSGVATGTNLWYMQLPYNTGKGEDGKVKYYGHRIYASVPNLVNTKYVSFLDEDNWLEPNFAQVMLDVASRERALTYTCQRIVHSSDGKKIGVDNFESIPINFADMNTYMIRTRDFCEVFAPSLAFGQWGADRELSKVTEKFYRININQPLVNYVSPARLDNYFRENIK